MLHILALLPAVYLILFVYRHDKIEKEPVSLLMKLLFFGALSIVPTVIFGTILELLLDIFISADRKIYNVIYMFIVVALVEEYWKRWAAKRAWDHPAFNYRFDAIVYCVSAALGFAALENLLYVAEGGLGTALLRAVTAVPSHAIDGVIMGIFFGEAKICEMRGDFRGKKYYWKLSLIIPMLAHGYYDYCLTSGSLLMLVSFLVFVIALDIWAIQYIKRASAHDEMI